MNKKREDFLIWQYRGKPKARQTVGLLLSESATVFKSAVKLTEILDIDKSTEWGLDLIGRHVGISRTMKSFVPKSYFGWMGIESALGFNTGVFYRYGDSLNDSTNLDDEDYRFFIKAKIIKNYQHPTLENITLSISYLLGEQAFIIDNYDMTMNIVIPSSYLTPFRLHAVKKLDILSRPIGVQYKYIVITDRHPFGWANDPHAFGFGDGKFTRIVDVNN
ncbi:MULTISPECIES: DUF2612 domain-containing protein [Photorhabdus]|uniref:Uncharacterized protein DUF2612 n=2 Tax=Photorhabdus asymbiotica TaxID=291112 RepID=A0ABX9SNG6_9GAMM|nr:DUF2612 domain-containing protein [Photorhabdus asymbiotica]RKS59564.1 uncharacterized protein DUF2612 [Photorhabdus asymbiotica]CAQ85182.1 similar to putative bacteriophage protein [Photorhabdus asymbiotica]CAQ85695.1 conserved hypothetical protein [Photorhabdus asymbiotica]